MAAPPTNDFKEFLEDAFTRTKGYETKNVKNVKKNDTKIVWQLPHNVYYCKMYIFITNVLYDME